jgi:hypothetical protein
VVVPGAAARSYVRPVVEALRGRGVQAHLLRAPGAPGCPVDMGAYGQQLGDQLNGSEPTDILIGLSVGPRPGKGCRLVRLATVLHAGLAAALRGTPVPPVPF